MKVKKIDKKLELNKKTISNLESSELKVIYGGLNDPRSMWISGCTCPPVLPQGPVVRTADGAVDARSAFKSRGPAGHRANVKGLSFLHKVFRI